MYLCILLVLAPMREKRVGGGGRRLSRRRTGSRSQARRAIFKRRWRQNTLCGRAERRELVVLTPDGRAAPDAVKDKGAENSARQHEYIL